MSARPYAGDVADPDGDGRPEVVVNDSDPYVFCYLCAVELKREVPYRWDGSRLVPVNLRAPVATLPAAVATFFVLGVPVQRYPDVLEQVVDSGHRIASHTVNHPSLARLTREEFIGEVVGGDEAIRAVVGDRADPLG